MVIAFTRNLMKFKMAPLCRLEFMRIKNFCYLFVIDSISVIRSKIWSKSNNNLCIYGKI